MSTWLLAKIVVLTILFARLLLNFRPKIALSDKNIYLIYMTILIFLVILIKTDALCVLISIALEVIYRWWLKPDGFFPGC